ncbi:MAG: HlyD family efflux transporter periplasmic adaptor subunit, partial [Deltaproteobacteria bacterium]|nr:HlyD family efflux transporter periplasmic adaptor subunit [Deltaproteobacteria bacterium]
NLASAEVAASFRGRIDAARALATMRKNRYAMLQELEKSGNARPEEMKRAETDLAMAQAQLQSALDDKKLKKLEADIIRAQIDEKKLRSPIDGIVVKIHKQQAELIGGNDQQAFMTIVQLDPLKAVFHLPQDVMGGMQAGEQISIDAGNKTVTGKIDFISPVINAQSGTIEVSIIIPNSDKSLTSGSRCTLTAP